MGSVRSPPRESLHQIRPQLEETTCGRAQQPPLSAATGPSLTLSQRCRKADTVPAGTSLVGRERQRERERESERECLGEIDRVCVCVWLRKRERERECVCVCACV